MIMNETEKLKPCPLCGREVSAHTYPSEDGTIIWTRIMHGATVPCGISFLDYEDEAVNNWNTRPNEEADE